MKNDKEEQFFNGYINVALEEYKSLRSESRQCNANLFTILYIGFGIIGILLTAGFSLIISDDTILITLLVFGILIPIIALSVSFLILFEAIRFKRLGNFLSIIESKLSPIFQEFIQNKIKDWTSRQEELEEILLFPHVPTNLSEPLVWGKVA